MKQTANASYLIAASLSLVLCACQPANKNHDEQPVAPEQQVSTKAATELQTDTAATELASKSKQLKQLTPEQAKAMLAQQQPAMHKKYKLNGELFTSESGQFIAGASLFNLQTNQTGRLTGSIVVVVAPAQVESSMLTSFGQVTELAQHTYNIAFASTQDLLAPYYQLLKTPGVQTVELQIDYTPKPTQESQ